MLLEVDGVTVHCRFNRRLKNTYLHVEPDGTVVLKSAVKDIKAFRSFVRTKLAWIETQRRHWAVHPVMQLGADILFLGEVVPLSDTALADDTDDTALKWRHRYDRFYRENAEKMLPEKTVHFAEQLQVDVKSIRFRRMKSRWGSCTKDGVITFNTLLLQLPETLIDYTVVHELAHRVHFNHAPAFHALVASVISDEKQCRTIMRYRKPVIY